MGQKVDPRSFRLGINREHDSSWYAEEDKYADYLHEDLKIRDYVEKSLKNSELDRVFIARDSKDQINLTIYAQRVGSILGKKGAGIEALKKSLSKLSTKKINVHVKEVPSGELSAKIVATQIAASLEKRTPFKKAMHFALNKAKKENVGMKISISGRLNGAEIARTEGIMHGKVPLHSLKYDIDFAKIEAKTIYGIIGIKVWVSKGIKKEVNYVNA